MNGKRLLSGLVIVAMLVVFVKSAAAMPPIGEPSVDFGSSSGVGDISPDVFAVAAADLDQDGSIDLATGSATATNELLVWENAGSPFSGTWSGGSGSAVGSTSGQVTALAMGDLDHDSALDLVAGDSSNAVTVWQNDGTPFDGAWSTNGTLGTGVGAIRALALADFDGDGNLDVVTASLSDGGAGYELIVWENPYSSSDTNPFDETWTAHNVASTVDLHSVAVADLNRDGSIDIAAGDTSNQVRVWSNDGSWGFTLQATLMADGDVEALVAIDLNRDGVTDLVSGGSVEGAGTHELIAWQNNTSWSFTGHDAGDTADVINGLATADFNHDGYADLAAGTDTAEDNEVIIWENDANETFGWSFTQVDVGAAAQSVEAVTVADFDADGDVDLALGRTADAGTGHEVALWENVLVHRNMPLANSAHIVGTGTSDIYALGMGDLDDDGYLDLLTGSRLGTGSEFIIWQNDGTPFSSAWTQTNVGDTNGHIDVVMAGDLDNDGDLDAVTGSGDSASELEIWQNDGDPFDGSGMTSSVAGNPDRRIRSLALGDLDRDGDLDIVSGGVHGTGDEIYVWENDGTPFDGTWSSTGIGTVGEAVRFLAVGDLDNDGDLDIASVTNHNAETYEIMIWQNDGTPFDGGWTSTDIANASAFVTAVAMGDMDGDGDLDLVTGSGTEAAAYEVIVWTNDGTPFDGGWTSTGVADITSAASMALDLADLDFDGDLDIVAGTAGGNIYAIENQGGSFDITTVGTDTAVYALRLGDLDNDGDADVAFGEASDEVLVWQNVGGSARLDVSERALSYGRIPDGEEDDVMEVVFTHNGGSSDADLELNTFYLKILRSDCSTLLTDAEANAIIDEVHVRLDDGNGTFEVTDTSVVTVTTLSLSTEGVQTVTFTDGDGDVQVSQGGTASRTYWITVKSTSDASNQDPNAFCVVFDPDADALVDAKSPDRFVSIQDTASVSTGTTPTAVTVLAFQAETPVDAALKAGLLVTGLGVVAVVALRRRQRSLPQ
jgi:hypothetical protein